MTKKTKKILLGGSVAAAGLAVGGVVSAALTKGLVSIAMDRKAPVDLSGVGGSKQLFVKPEEKESVLEAAESAALRLEKCNSELVEIVGHDGEKLVGHWVACDRPKRVIVAMHGWRSSWVNDFSLIADFWRDNGCSVLYAEQRGQSASGGDYIGFGLIERYDCLDWINWVNCRTAAELPVFLAGISMGASTVLMASGLQLPKNVCGIMADCGYTSIYEIWKHVTEDNLHLSYRLRENFADKMCRDKINMGTNEYSTIDALKVNTVPVMFVHGTDDRLVPVEMTYENYQACRAPKRLLIVPGADHGMSYIKNKAEYEQMSINFWHDCEALLMAE